MTPVVARTVDIACQQDDCDVRVLILIGPDGTVDGYQPRCHHQQAWTRVVAAAEARMATEVTTAGPHEQTDPEAEAGPDQGEGIASSRGDGTTPPAEAIPCSCGGPYRFTTPSTCWCGEYQWPEGHGMLHCDSEAGHARDREAEEAGHA